MLDVVIQRKETVRIRNLIEFSFQFIYKLLTIFRGHKEVNLATSGDRPHLHDGGPQLQVRLVHLRRLADVDLQIIADQSKQRGCEGYTPLLVYWHIHPYQTLVSHLVWALLTKTKRRVNVLQ